MKVLFILADALRADRLHCCGNPWPTSPTIDRLAAEGVRFTNVIANANHTVPGLVSAFTGLYVTAHGIRDQASFSNWCDPGAGDARPFTCCERTVTRWPAMTRSSTSRWVSSGTDAT